MWYVDMTPSGHDWLITPIRELKDAAVATGSFHTQPIARLLPFFDWMGGPFPRNPTKKEFWWEREWRHAGTLQLGPIWDKVIWLCPADEHDAFRERVLAATPGGEPASSAFIDPRWGLEQVIAHLAGLSREDATLFGASPGHTEAIEPPPF